MAYTDMYDFTGGTCDKTYVLTKGEKVVIGIIYVICIVFIVLVSIFLHNYYNPNTDKVSNVEEPVEEPVQAPAQISNNFEPSEDPISTFSNNIDPFTNDLPYQLQNKSISLSPDDDYSEILKTMSLDQDVINQHNQYVNDRNKITSTASFAPSRSDNQDIVTTWGLAKPTYVNIDPSARNVPSQDPEQGSKPIRLQWK